MKLTDLLLNQTIIVQLVWGEQKIEFSSNVIENDNTVVYVNPYFHNGSILELNVIPDKGVICNIFTDNKSNNQRISWKNVELTTVERNNDTVYCIKTRGFNNIAVSDDRRVHERVIVDVDGQMFDEFVGEGGARVTIHDISDIGISFYLPESFELKSQQVTLRFTDIIGTRTFSVKVDGIISRSISENGHIVVGCKVAGENKDYLLYGLMKRLMSRNYKVNSTDTGEQKPENDADVKDENKVEDTAEDNE